ncbi:hypothetical protein IW262DRAFT_1454990 [Armillaria fumosa]|nr:hypothetical protein IW262DRAFT_1454990 [Armillaria fumosa]
MASCSFAPLSENIVIFEIGRAARRGTRSYPAHLYLLEVARYFLAEWATQSRRKSSSRSPQSHRITNFSLSMSEIVMFLAGRPEYILLFPLQCGKQCLYHRFKASVKFSDATLSTLEFLGPSLTIEQVAMICEVVADGAPGYSVATSQCSWYTETIYRIVQETQKGQFKKRSTVDDKRMDMNYELNISEVSNRWDEWKADIEKNIQEMNEDDRKLPETEEALARQTQKTMYLQQEVDRLKKELAKSQKKTHFRE